MREQMTLFGPTAQPAPSPAHNGTDTSREAAASIDPNAHAWQRSLILGGMDGAGTRGMTLFEVVYHLHAKGYRHVTKSDVTSNVHALTNPRPGTDDVKWLHKTKVRRIDPDTQRSGCVWVHRRHIHAANMESEA